MICKICGFGTQKIFSEIILNKYKVSCFFCGNCHFLQTEEPYWLEEAYQCPINVFDTGVLARNISLSKTFSAIIIRFFNRTGQFVDYAGGYGIFVRLMRDYGFDFYWIDPYAQNLFARFFEYHNSVEKIELVTAIECFEHFKTPLSDIEKVFSIAKNILFTTDLLPYPIPSPHKWWYYGFEHGQHLSFYSKKTLLYLAMKYGKNLCSFSNIHLLTEKNINQYSFESVINYRKYLAYFNKYLMKSKTVDDMDYVVKNSK